jgi:hypothetical protein
MPVTHAHCPTLQHTPQLIRTEPNASKNHGVVASCSSHLLNELKALGQITGKEQDASQSCVARAM